MSHKILIALILCFLGSYSRTFSQVSLVKDINTMPAGVQDDNNSLPIFCQCGGNLYFSLTTELGRELWKTDGTESGTKLVIDVRKYSYGGLLSQIYGMACLNDKLFFIADDGKTGHELWSTDGTAAGTVLVKDTEPNLVTNYMTSSIVKVADKIYYILRVGLSVVNLWQSDGTTAGTTLVSTIDASALGTASIVSSIGSEDYIYFKIRIIRSGFSTNQLWRSDGTGAGTTMIRESSQFIVILGSVDGNVFFNELNDLWVTDGTIDGTKKLMTFVSSPGSALEYGDKLIFNVRGDMWISNGTSLGTFKLADDTYVNAGRTYLGEFYGFGYSKGNDFLLRTDGTPAGTTKLKFAGIEHQSLLTDEIPMIGDKFILPIYSSEHGYEPVLMNPISSETQLIKDIFTGIDSSKPRAFTTLNDKAYFVANDNMYGHEIWSTDGTEVNTKLVKDVKSGTDDGILQAFFEALDDKIYFFGTSDGFLSRAIWMSDGTEEGTIPIEIDGLIPRYLGRSENHLYFADYVNLLRINGTGVQTIKESTDNGGLVGAGRGFKDKFIFSSQNVGSGEEYWVTDGTDQGTFLLKDIYPGSLSGFAGIGDEVNDKLVIVAKDDISGGELWVTDATTEGTVFLKDINPGIEWSFPTEFVKLNNQLLFSATDDIHGTELWKTDATTAGTTLVKDIFGSGSSSPKSLVRLGDHVFFTAYDDANGWTLWKSDGTGEGTKLAVDVIDGSDVNNAPSLLTEAGSKIFFVADDKVHGSELWVTDGTVAGTHVIDIIDGAEGSEPSLLTKVGESAIYFRCQGALWRSDGTIANTEQVGNLEPLYIRQINDWIYFVAYSQEYGKELFKVPFTKIDQSIMFEPIRITYFVFKRFRQSLNIRQ